MFNEKPPYTTLVDIKNSLLKKELEVKSFVSPCFIKRKNIPLFFSKAKENLTNNIGLFKSMRDALGVVDKNYTKNKQNNLKKEPLNNLFNANVDKGVKNDLLKEVLIQSNTSNPIFTSYVEKLHKISNRVSEVNKNINNLHQVKANLNQTNDFNVNSTNTQFNKQNSLYNSYVNNNFLQKSLTNAPNFKSNALDLPLKKELYSENNKTNNLSTTKYNEDNKELTTLLINSIKEIRNQCKDIKTVLTNLEVKNQNLYNKLIKKLDKKIQKKFNNILPSLKDIKSEIKNIYNHKDLKSNTLKDALKQIESSLNDWKKTADLNGVDLEVIQDTLKEILTLFKETNQDVKQIINKHQVAETSFNEELVNEKFNCLEERINNYNREQFSFLTKQLECLNKTQEDGFKNQLQNKEVIINEINSIKNNFNNKPGTLESLSSKLNDIISCQKNLLNDAEKIKKYVLTSNKEISYIKDTHTNSSKLITLVNDLKDKNLDKEKEQVQLNEKMHQDMEIIKKSIIKLIDKQQKALSNSGLNVTKQLNNSSNQQNRVHKESANNIESKSEEKEATYHSNTENPNNIKASLGRSNLSQMQMMAIGKLKEALDLESLEPNHNVKKDNINEIIEDQISTSVKELKNNSEDIINSKNSKIKESQSTFVLDTSKFFK